MTLEEWQALLDKHFSLLREERKSGHASYSVYALEHGLDSAALGQLQEDVRTAFRKGVPAGYPFLPWVVYGAEVGYRYSGDEYWQSFEDQTPRWEYADREALRLAFMRFRHTYGGATPTGAWARNFSIISWPITHAILPLDLQRSLARLLYEVRYSLSAEHLENPPKLGQLLRARSQASSSRFR